MNAVDPLLTTLLDLLYELRDADFPLVLVGGYGLYIRQERLQESGEPTLLEAIPPLRATNDLDVFLRTELVTDSERLRPLRGALYRLGFMVIPSAQNYQFARKFTLAGQDWDIKIDLTAKPPDLRPVIRRGYFKAARSLLIQRVVSVSAPPRMPDASKMTICVT